MPGQQQRGPVADFQILRGDGNALAGNVLDLIPETFRIQRHAVAQNVYHTRAEQAGGEQVQGEFAVFIDNGMPGVAAALVADDHVIIRREQVYHTALAFVAPVNANDRCVCHNCFLLNHYRCASRRLMISL